MKTCDNFTCGNLRRAERYDAATDCPKCWAAMHNRHVAASLGRELVPLRDPLPEIPESAPGAPLVEAEPCRFLGDLLCAKQRIESGKDHAKLWRFCLHVVKPLGEVVCPCQGCGTACPGYSAEAEWSMLVTAGIGDSFAIEGMLAPEERETLGAIYYACPAAAEVEMLFRALPNYPMLKRHVRLSTGNTVHYSAETVAAQTGPLPAGVQDWSIATVFPKARPYLGSSFLTHRLASPDLPPSPYVVVVPHSTWGQWSDRSFSATDWKTCLDFLDRHRLTGVVLCRESLPLPAHPRLLDWQGRTSILESVEILKAAQGLLSVDSMLTVLAAKLFPASRIAVKSVWGHCYNWKHVYYAPRREFGFLNRTLEAPSWN